MVIKEFYDIGPPSFNSLFELYNAERELRSGDQLLVSVPHCNTLFAERNFPSGGSGYRTSLDSLNAKM